MTYVSYQDISVMTRALAARRCSRGAVVDERFYYDMTVMVRESLWLWRAVQSMTALA